MAADLALRGLSSGTRAAYLRYAQKFIAFHKRSPHELGVEHVRTWVLHLLQVKGQRALQRAWAELPNARRLPGNFAVWALNEAAPRQASPGASRSLA